MTRQTRMIAAVIIIVCTFDLPVSSAQLLKGGESPNRASIASRRAADRRLSVSSHTPRDFFLDANLERWVSAWIAQSYVINRVFAATGESPAVTPGTSLSPQVRPEPLHSLLPAVDEFKLNSAQIEAWHQTRSLFVSTEQAIHVSRSQLDELSAHLRARDMELNAQHQRSASQMEGFLNDAANLIRGFNFEEAQQALARADYVRRQLQIVTGSN